MAGSLTLGGMAAGGPGGSLTFGPSTVVGSEAVAEVVNVLLEANVDTAVKVPAGAKQWAVFFATGGSATEVKIGSNLVATTAARSRPAQGFVSDGLAASETELKFRASSPPSVFQVVFI